MDIHPKFATWLASANITPNDETLRKWWTGLDGFTAAATDIVSLLQLAKGADTTAVTSRFHAALQKEDTALLPSQKLAIAALAAAKLHCIIEVDSAEGELAALLCAISFPAFEAQPAYRTDLSALAEKTLSDSSRARADLNALLNQLDDGTALAAGELERILAVTVEETNILWWIFGGHSRDNNDAFADIADDVIPFVAAKELADLTTILPGPVAVPAFTDRVCQTGRTKAPTSLAVTATIKKLPASFVAGVAHRWTGNNCLPLCRLTQEIINKVPGWTKSQKLRTTELAQLFYRECLVPRAWEKAAP